LWISLCYINKNITLAKIDVLRDIYRYNNKYMAYDE
jgi:hypothetical protein